MNPVIVLGMHRSGTSLVSRMLQRLGVFMGADLQDDGESLTLITLAETVFAAAGATWDRPLAVAELLDDPVRCRVHATELRRMLIGREGRGFLGRQYSWVELTGWPWGWKDPRSCFTLPAWRMLWPRAPVVHVTRNGIDVAASLFRRHRRIVAEYTQVFGTPPGERFLLAEVPFTHRAGTLSGGFTLWQEYLRHTERQLAGVTTPVLRLRYEDLVRRPEAVVGPLARFCGYAPEPARLEAMVAEVRAQPPYAFTAHPQLRTFARLCLDEGTELFGYREEIERALAEA